MKYTILRPFLVVYHELERNSCFTRPMGMWRGCPVTHHVSRIRQRALLVWESVFRPNSKIISEHVRKVARFRRVIECLELVRHMVEMTHHDF